MAGGLGPEAQTYSQTKAQTQTWAQIRTRRQTRTQTGVSTRIANSDSVTFTDRPTYTSPKTDIDMDTSGHRHVQSHSVTPRHIHQHTTAHTGSANTTIRLIQHGIGERPGPSLPMPAAPQAPT